MLDQTIEPLKPSVPKVGGSTSVATPPPFVNSNLNPDQVPQPASQAEIAPMPEHLTPSAAIPDMPNIKVEFPSPKSSPEPTVITNTEPITAPAQTPPEATILDSMGQFNSVPPVSDVELNGGPNPFDVMKQNYIAEQAQATQAQPVTSPATAATEQTVTQQPVVAPEPTASAPKSWLSKLFKR